MRVAVLLALACSSSCLAFIPSGLRLPARSPILASTAPIIMKQPQYERFSEERIARERSERKAVNDKVIPALAIAFIAVKLAGGFDLLPESTGPSYGPPGLAKVQEWKTERGGVNRLPQAMPSRAGQ